jgi:hypothetical protein
MSSGCDSYVAFCMSVDGISAGKPSSFYEQRKMTAKVSQDQRNTPLVRIRGVEINFMHSKLSASQLGPCYWGKEELPASTGGG